MALKPWYTEVQPREDLREDRPLDASEFAVHLDQVRTGKAPDDYTVPDRFFDRTYLTKNLGDFAGEVVRRLSGETKETSAVFNMATQFGGGKTHALTMLYHLAKHGSKSQSWKGVREILDKARVKSVPTASVGIFVGTEFDAIKGRGGSGEPLRKTPWGELAWQIGGQKAFDVVAEHDRKHIEPKGDVIREFLPKDKPCLILMDEILNYVSSYRREGHHNSMYNFLQALSETARGEKNVVLVVSIPASEMNYMPDDEADQQRFKKMLDRLGKAVVMSAEAETSEIIRRRLFEWSGIPDSGRKAAAEYERWVQDHKDQIPNWFSADQAREAFEATYPFHPMVLSVFERKWRVLPKFQQTRGILRLLALWVSKAYQDQCKGKNKDPLIGLGTAPLDDSLFRRAVFEQLGEDRLEAAVTTDIAGKKDAHSARLDREAGDTIKKAGLHRKSATVIFFESNGGQLKAEATLPEIRLAVAEPSLDIGNVETVLDALTEACYYLLIERKNYKFTFKENLNKRFADRRASIQPEKIEEHVRGEIQKVFREGKELQPPIFFPEKSNQVPDRPSLSLCVLAPDQAQSQDHARKLVESIVKEHGASARTFKSALIWAAPDPASTLLEEARKALAWEDILEEADALHFDEAQRKQLSDSVKRADRDLRESVWRTYNTLMLLSKDGGIRTIDLGLITSSSSSPKDGIVGYYVQELTREGELEASGLSPNSLVKNWPPALKEWSTKSVRDAVYASPKFVRPLNPDSIRDTIARGVTNGLFAYVGKSSGGDFKPFAFERSICGDDIEISEDLFLISKEAAEAYVKAKSTGQPAGPVTISQPPTSTAAHQPSSGGSSGVLPAVATAKRISWQGEVPPQRWTNFYMKVLSKHASGGRLKINVSVEIEPEKGASPHLVEEMRVALRELGLPDSFDIH